MFLVCIVFIDVGQISPVMNLGFLVVVGGEGGVNESAVLLRNLLLIVGFKYFHCFS